MNVTISENAAALGKAAGQLAADLIKDAIRKRGEAYIILATGTSQFETLNALLDDPAINWSAVTMFHLDEYIGLSEQHPASFRKYLKERVLARTGSMKQVYLIDGERHPQTVIDKLNAAIRDNKVDVALVGIGENGHLAFNDPPADFETEEPYIVVRLDKDCRLQQLGEGWFPTLDDVPVQAISMSVNQIMKSEAIICSVPDGRKALAVKKTIESPVDPSVPSSILKEHKAIWLFIDNYSAALLS